MHYSFLKGHRLLNPQDYKMSKKMGCKFTTPHFVLYVRLNDHNRPRLGMTVSRRIGNAVKRNYIKRRLREFFRHNQYDLKSFDYSIIARRNADRLTYNEICRELSFISEILVDK